RRFVMTYPNEQLPAGRPLKMAPAHDAMTQAGATWGCTWGLETPLMFAPQGFEETPSLRRSNAHPIVGEEVAAVRDRVGLLDISGFSRFEITGPGAEAWLNGLMATRLPKPGRARLAVMLAPNGRLKGDLTLFNWGDGTWWIMGSYYLREWHLRWFTDHLGPDVSVSDISDATVGFALAGPKSRDVLQALTHEDLSTLSFMGCRPMDVGLLRARVGRLSVTGELGYEINVPAAGHIALRRMLLEAGRDAGIREIGFYALNSLRLEKSFGIWSAEFTQDRTPAMTGMDRWIDWDKPAFTGRDAVLATRNSIPPQRLVTIAIDATDADASGYEPIWKGGKRVGFITSGGYGHHVGASLAMAMIDPDAADGGTDLSVHVVGEERAAQVIPPSPHDPEGLRMRG
ncbi:MAG: aminomethyltransferase family protein, partial [Pseudomonadota bacterium]